MSEQASKIIDAAVTGDASGAVDATQNLMVDRIRDIIAGKYSGLTAPPLKEDEETEAETEVKADGVNEDHWMADAVKPSHEGKFGAKAKRAGMSTHAYAEKERHAPGTLGKEARLALTFEKIAKKK